MKPPRDRALLFVYGTLRRGSGRRPDDLLGEEAEFVGRATFRGRLYDVDDYPGAVPSGDPSDTVHGEIYRLTNAEAVLRRIDKYEEVDSRDPSAGLYRREITEVALEDGHTTQAWIYLFNRPTRGLRPIPSGEYPAQPLRSRGR